MGGMGAMRGQADAEWEVGQENERGRGGQEVERGKPSMLLSPLCISPVLED